MTTITDDNASTIQRRRSAFLDGTLRSMSNGGRSSGQRIAVLEMVGRVSMSATQEELSDSYRVTYLLCVVEFHEIERESPDEASSHLGRISTVRKPNKTKRSPPTPATTT